tara:strand:+ start:1488 stop:2528 length:1041 start_codon:yes stop_codon:yes gene_type:complete
MALTKIGSIGINTGIAFAGVTTIATLNASDNVLSVGGTVNFVSDVSIGGTVSIAGTLTYEDVTNVDAVGLITARDGIKVGSGITLSVDGDIFATGVVTATTFSGAFSGDGSALTGVANTDVIFTDKISLPDTSGFVGSINVGLSSDLQISHNGSKSMIRGATATNIDIKTAADFFVTHADTDGSNGENCIVARADGEVELYHDGSKKLETDGSGVTVTGRVAATSYTGDGSALTGIQAGIQTAVPKSVSGITTVLDLSKDDFKITAAGITTVDVRGGSEGNSHTLRIVNSGITTVGFSTYFLFPSGGTPNLPTTDGAISLISFTVHRQGAVGLATQLLSGASVNFS